MSIDSLSIVYHGMSEKYMLSTYLFPLEHDPGTWVHVHEGLDQVPDELVAWHSRKNERLLLQEGLRTCGSCCQRTKWW